MSTTAASQDAADAAIDRLRRNIDTVDEVLVKLLNQRAKWAQEIGAVKKLVVGPGMAAGTNIGPLINSAAIAKVETLVGDAVKKGAKILIGGGLDNAGPLFYRPSVVGAVTPDMDIVREEIFGPVAALVRFDTEADAVKLANDTPFGLAAYLFSQNLSRAWRVAEKLACHFSVNVGDIDFLERCDAKRVLS